jgi:hypothetical protein
MGSQCRHSSQRFTFIWQYIGFFISLPFLPELDRSSIGFGKILRLERGFDNPT